jgi:uncharacterized C2H2 Zn-finger protein
MSRCPACGLVFEDPGEWPDHAAVQHGLQVMGR